MTVLLLVGCMLWQPRAAAEEPIPSAANVKDYKSEPRSVCVYEYDQTPLDNRKPLLMVHGLRGELWSDDFRYQKLCAYLSQNPEFAQKYKIYLARYNSYLQLSDLSEQFKRAITDLRTRTGKTITIVALSMGGNVVAQAMTDSGTDSCVERVLTLGTPFHGSPLFTPSWMELGMLRHHKTPFTQLDTTLPYEIYFSAHKNLLCNLNWDNSDLMIPQSGQFRIWFRTGRRTLTPESSSNNAVFQLNADGRINKKKFIVYGGYLQTPFTQGADPWWRRAARSPVWFSTTVLPEHFGKEHAVLRSLNQQMAYAPVRKESQTDGFVYGLNDGITPLTSSLFLPNQVMSTLVLSNQSDVTRLKTLTDVARARVFAGIDHLTFIDEYIPKGGSPQLKDQLSESEPAKPMFAWILSDLLSTSAEELAVGPKQGSIRAR